MRPERVRFVGGSLDGQEQPWEGGIEIHVPLAYEAGEGFNTPHYVSEVYIYVAPVTETMTAMFSHLRPCSCGWLPPDVTVDTVT